MVKLTDYIAHFLAAQGVKHVYGVVGGSSLHLMHSIAKNPNLEMVCPLHEQAAAMAADGGARMTGVPGVCIATSGPGATNLLTGVAGAYFDSVPLLVLCGSTATYRQKGNLKVRQLGFQELDTAAIFRPVVKDAYTLETADQIGELLPIAWDRTRRHRPGPALLVIPDDLQRALIEPPRINGPTTPYRLDPQPDAIESSWEMIRQAERPVMIVGWGCRLAKAEAELLDLITALGIPVCPTWGMIDFLPDHHYCRVGAFGTHGTRAGNFTVQNADLILSIGARLDTKATGSPPSTFAPQARKIVVDLDPAELGKFDHVGLPSVTTVRCDAGAFCHRLGSLIRASAPYYPPPLWLERVKSWKAAYSPATAELLYSIDPYSFAQRLSDACPENMPIYVDTGCTVAWMTQAFRFKRGQRLYHDCNNTAMGWALPAAIGGCLASGRKPVLCVVGDGSLHLNAQELATIQAMYLPISIICLNNQGYAMVRQTQDQWFSGEYIGTNLPSVNWRAVAEGYGMTALQVSRQPEAWLPLLFRDTAGPIFMEVLINPTVAVSPIVRAGRPLEDADPLLSREELAAQMTI